MKRINNPFTILACWVLLLAGCSTMKKAEMEAEFYPPAPEEPKLQYLTSFSLPSDLAPPPSAFRNFVLGEENKKSKPGIIKPYGLSVQGSKIYVCDTMGGVVHTLDVETRKWDYFRSSEMGKPFNIAVDHNSTRYITDITRKRVQIYSAAGMPIGALDENIEKPTGIAISADRIYVGDIESHQVHVFEKKSRNLKFSIPLNPDNEQEQLFSPTNIALDQEGNIYVSDLGSFRIQKYDADGKYLRTFGGIGTAPGRFARNKGIALDRDNNLYVVDAAFQNIQIFNEEGDLLLYFGDPGGSAYPMTLPADVFIDYENVERFQKYAAPNFELEYLVFVTNQYGNRKVAVYGFGRHYGHWVKP
jgi:DNA-binding beta-propeller fold protein YncE